MRIIEIVPTLEEEASGPSYSVPRLAQALADVGNDVHLMSVGGQASGVGVSIRQTRYHHDLGSIPTARSLFLSQAMNADLRVQARDVDLIHSHGLWVMPNVYPAWAARRAHVPYVASPRGTLGAIPLTYSPRIKKTFWWLLQGTAVRQAACLHATSEQEYREIRAFGLKQPVTIIPNGIDIPAARAPGPRNVARRRLLYLGRIHPKKGIEALLNAWAGLERRFPDWELRLVGVGPEPYMASLKALGGKLGLERADFAGPRYGAEKASEYANADLFILPSLNENFGMTVAEALAESVPVVTTTGTPWRGVEDQGCGWWVAPDAVGIETALSHALAANVDHLAEMGRRGRDWMSRDFAWKRIAQEMAEVYRWIVHGGSVPATVRLD
jgi:glycosyltransferase involved in cell wall biosynthesis